MNVMVISQRFSFAGDIWPLRTRVQQQAICAARWRSVDGDAQEGTTPKFDDNLLEIS
jgi:hypothetical protein